MHAGRLIDKTAMLGRKSAAFSVTVYIFFRLRVCYMYTYVRSSWCERSAQAWRDKWQTVEIYSRRARRGGRGFRKGSLQGVKQRTVALRRESVSIQIVGRVGWRAFGATIALPFSSPFSSNAQQKAGTGEKREPRVTRRADNAGEMCTGIIFPSKCGVIEKKNEKPLAERKGKGRWRERRGGNSTLPKLSGLYFAG